jgi:hypothetical protein
VGSELRRIVEGQFGALCRALGVPGGALHTYLAVLAGEALQAPPDGARRASNVNADGGPFQWSVSVGERPGGLRLLTDCAPPGIPISAQVQYARARLGDLGGRAYLDEARPEIDLALKCLLPAPALWDGLSSGLWFAAGVTPGGEVSLKVYVNQQVDDAASRYFRFADALAAFGRRQGLQRLDALVRVVGNWAVPVLCAFDVQSSGLGRLKLYFRTTDGNPGLLTPAAEAVGCGEAAANLALLHRTLLDGPAYPSAAVIFSAEFPADDGPAGFKVDLYAPLLHPSDAATDRRILQLLDRMGLPADEYRAAYAVLAGAPSTEPAARVVWVGLAQRRHERRVNVYFHP